MRRKPTLFDLKKRELKRALKKLKEVNEVLPTLPMADWTDVLGEIRSEAKDIVAQLDAFIHYYYNSAQIHTENGDDYMVEQVKKRIAEMTQTAA